MTIVARKVLLGAMLTLLNFSTRVNSSAAQQGTARQNAAAPNNASRIENARMESRHVAGTLAATMAEAEKNAASPMWVGYAVKAVEGERTICCGNYRDSRGGGCGRGDLETEGNNRNKSGKERR